MITDYNIFLDDVRIPTQVTWADIPQYQHYSLVRNYNEFISLILARGLPKYVCYDHDLANEHYSDAFRNVALPYNSYTEKTGYDCAKWLVNYCMEKDQDLPEYIVHSMNPAGGKNIWEYLENYRKFREKEEYNRYHGE